MKYSTNRMLQYASTVYGISFVLAWRQTITRGNPPITKHVTINLRSDQASCWLYSSTQETEYNKFLLRLILGDIENISVSFVYSVIVAIGKQEAIDVKSETLLGKKRLVKYWKYDTISWGTHFWCCTSINFKIKMQDIPDYFEEFISKSKWKL